MKIRLRGYKCEILYQNHLGIPSDEPMAEVLAALRVFNNKRIKINKNGS